MKIAIFYHTRLSGGEPHIDFDHASGIMAEQMDALEKSGLMDATSHMLIGVNGGMADAAAAAMLSPDKATLTAFPEEYRGELPTLYLLRLWAIENPGWAVFYHHTKGAIHLWEPFYANWRRCMERVCVWNWQRCIDDLQRGADSVGAHWLTKERFPGQISTPFWGGNFWWATSDYLATLPEMPRTAVHRTDFYQAETWISTGPRLPRVSTYADHWPGGHCAQ